MINKNSSIKNPTTPKSPTDSGRSPGSEHTDRVPKPVVPSERDAPESEIKTKVFEKPIKQ